jgi:hypothetical protein
MNIQACQDRDWPQHKQECAALKQWMSQTNPETYETAEIGPPNDAIRALARILWRRMKLGAESPFVRGSHPPVNDVHQLLSLTVEGNGHYAISYVSVSNSFRSC